MKSVLVFTIVIVLVSAAVVPTLGFIGGRDAKVGEFPYQVSLQLCLFSICVHSCNGALISSEWVLTSGQCKVPPDVAQFTTMKIYAGTADDDKDTANLQIRDLDSFTAHPDFINGRSPFSSDDIALVKVKKAFQLNKYIQPIALPSSASQKIIGPVTYSGWGSVDHQPNYGSTLQTADLPLVENAKCSELLNSLYSDEDVPFRNSTNFCTGPLDKNIKPCFLDIGSPTVKDGVIVGITSSVYEYDQCFSLGKPTVHTKVEKYLDFIKQYVK